MITTQVPVQCVTLLRFTTDGFQISVNKITLFKGYFTSFHYDQKEMRKYKKAYTDLQKNRNSQFKLNNLFQIFMENAVDMR